MREINKCEYDHWTSDFIFVLSVFLSSFAFSRFPRSYLCISINQCELIWPFIHFVYSLANITDRMNTLKSNAFFPTSLLCCCSHIHNIRVGKGFSTGFYHLNDNFFSSFLAFSFVFFGWFSFGFPFQCRKRWANTKSFGKHSIRNCIWF